MTISPELVFFSFFLIFVFTVLYADLFLIGRNRHIVSVREASIWTTVWVMCAVGFYLILFFHGEKIHGIKDLAGLVHYKTKYFSGFDLIPGDYIQSLTNFRQNMSLEYITGYIIEYSLSVDNIFVILMLFGAYNVSMKNYKRVLFYGILGAVVLRCIFIFAGAALLERFEWLLIVFGVFLVFTGVKMFIQRNKEEKIDTKDNKLVIFMSKHFPLFPRYVKGNFLIKKKGKYMITPLLLVLIIIEFTDLLFAVDSIPAIFSVTRDPYIVFFSNIFAILGLRSLFFLLMNAMNKFHFLKVGLSVLLTFIGLKLMGGEHLKEIGFKTIHSLYIIVAILGVSVLASMMYPKKEVK